MLENARELKEIRIFPSSVFFVPNNIIVRALDRERHIASGTRSISSQFAKV